MTESDELDRMLAERACERLMVDYAWFIDSGVASRVADLFATNGRWEGADGSGMVGQAEIRAAFERREQLTRRQARHVITNVRIDVQPDGRATGTACLVQYRHDASSGPAIPPAPADHPKFVGDYFLTFLRTSTGWRIESLRFAIAFLRTKGPR